MNLKNEDIINKEIVQLLKDYEYEYADKPQKPILIVGPSGNGDTHLRVYAYGGRIGEIATEQKTHCKLAFMKDKDGEYSYGKYLKDGYENGHGLIFDYKLVPELKRLQDKLGENLYVAFAELNRKCSSKEEKYEMISNQKYLDIIVSAAYTRFMHRTKDAQQKTIIKGLSERSKQTLIAKQCQTSAWDRNVKNMVVVDIEYDISLHDVKECAEECVERTQWNAKQKKKVLKEKAKIDFVVFDGTSFGLVEFKYQGESMEKGTNNSLEEHYLDFQRIIFEDKNTNKIDVIRELIRRTDILIRYEIIDKSWAEPLKELQGKIENMKPEEYDSSMLWCGFYFVGTGGKDIQAEINKQIPIEGRNGSKMIVKYQLDDDLEENTICM